MKSEIRFKLNVCDISLEQKLNRRAWVELRREARWSVYNIVISVVFTVLCAIPFILFLVSYVGFLRLIVVYLVISPWAVILAVSYTTNRRRLGRIAAEMRECTIRLTGADLYIEAGNMSTVIRNAAIKDVDVWRNHLVCTLENERIFIVPLRAFSSKEEATVWYSALTNKAPHISA